MDPRSLTAAAIQFADVAVRVISATGSIISRLKSSKGKVERALIELDSLIPLIKDLQGFMEKEYDTMLSSTNNEHIISLVTLIHEAGKDLKELEKLLSRLQPRSDDGLLKKGRKAAVTTSSEEEILNRFGRIERLKTSLLAWLQYKNLTLSVKQQ
jgi:hypothetical protein